MAARRRAYEGLGRVAVTAMHDDVETAEQRSSWTELDLGALRRNTRLVLDRVGAAVLIASVKANAYGHGVEACAHVLEQEGAGAMATASLDEAIRLRRAGIEMPLILYASETPLRVTELIAHRVSPTVCSVSEAASISDEAESEVSVFVKLDAGLGRLGVPLDEAVATVVRMAALPRIRIDGIYSHLPFTSDDGRTWAIECGRKFVDVVRTIESKGISVQVVQLLSSSGVIAGLSTEGTNAVCVGHALYGLPAVALADGADFSGFQPVFHALKARLLHVARHPRTRSAGSGGDRTYAAGTVTGVVPVGVCHGFRAKDLSKAAVLVGGRRAPIVRISLANMTVDLTQVGDVNVGDEVVLIGTQGPQCLRLDNVAESLGTSVLELLATLNDRFPRIYSDDESSIETTALRLERTDRTSGY